MLTLSSRQVPGRSPRASCSSWGQRLLEGLGCSYMGTGKVCFPVKCQLMKPLHALTLTMFEGRGEPTLKADLCLSSPSPAQRDTPLPLQREGNFSYKASTKHLELAGSQSHSITTHAFIWEDFSFTRLNAELYIKTSFQGSWGFLIKKDEELGREPSLQTAYYVNMRLSSSPQHLH